MYTFAADQELAKGSLYLALTGETWGIFCVAEQITWYIKIVLRSIIIRNYCVRNWYSVHDIRGEHKDDTYN